MKQPKQPKITTRSKEFGFWMTRKKIQRGIKIYEIVPVDLGRSVIEQFGRLDFARKLCRAHNNEILQLFEKARIEQNKKSLKADIILSAAPAAYEKREHFVQLLKASLSAASTRNNGPRVELVEDAVRIARELFREVYGEDR